MLGSLKRLAELGGAFFHQIFEGFLLGLYLGPVILQLLQHAVKSLRQVADFVPGRTITRGQSFSPTPVSDAGQLGKRPGNLAGEMRVRKVPKQEQK